MIGILLAVAAVLLVAVLAWIARGRRAAGSLPARGPARVVFPFLGAALSRPALDAALRLARSDGATLVPVYLAQVPLHLPLDVALPRQSALAVALLEAVEQQARRCGVRVDARIERGRTPRHALRELVAHERYDRMVLAAATNGSGDGFRPEETAWVLANVPGEIVVLRPNAKGHTATAPSLAG
jgi:nucleotide-binding universal stress UspA family protein